jgi:Arc/MetJ-type ribon-helix-helix transcriptional regulator
MNRRLRSWNIPVPPALDDALELAVKRDMHVSKSDYVREAVREKLAREGFLPVKRGENEK